MPIINPLKDLKLQLQNNKLKEISYHNTSKSNALKSVFGMASSAPDSYRDIGRGFFISNRGGFSFRLKLKIYNMTYLYKVIITNFAVYLRRRICCIFV